MISENIMHSLKSEGLIIYKNEDLECWSNFKNVIDKYTAEFFKNSNPNALDSSNLNAVRLNAFRALNAMENWDKNYYKMASKLLDALFGPDLLIQRKLNLSIQMPNDKSSILGMHTDTLSGQSPFEFVMWTAFSKSYDSNSMFYFDRQTSKKIFL